MTTDHALGLLDRVIADPSMGQLVFEAQARSGQISYFAGTTANRSNSLQHLIEQIVPEAQVSDATERPHITFAGQLKISRPSESLNVQDSMSIARAVMAGLAAANKSDEAVLLQLMIGGRLASADSGTKPGATSADWLDLLLRGRGNDQNETTASHKIRSTSHNAKVIVRLGAHAPTIGRTRQLLTGVLGGMRVAQGNGIRIKLAREPSSKIMEARRPWRWPLRLSSRELVSLIGWPLEDSDKGPLPGQRSRHPRSLRPQVPVATTGHPFAETTSPGRKVQFGIRGTDSLQHTAVLGPTGSGKSTVLLAMILDAVYAGRGLLVIDPKADLVNETLARVPEDRAANVVVIDPTDPRPVGIQPLATEGKDAALTADSLLAVFKELSGDSWGVRTQDVLYSALLTLCHIPGATLPMLPPLLTNDSYRQRQLHRIADEIALQEFWANYDAMSHGQRSQVIAPTLTRLRQFLLRPQLRSVLGQPSPKFRLQDLFTKRRIVLVSLNRGLSGKESAKLLGSLIVGQLWPLILQRAGLPPERRHIVNIFIDEMQDFLATQADLEDALSQARGLGVGFTLAHQYRKQLPPTVRAGIDANARNKIIFGLNADDASDMAKQAPELAPEDFLYLPLHHIYTNLMRDGHSTGWFSARTLPPVAATGSAAELRAQSAARYGGDCAQVEADLRRATGTQSPKTSHGEPDSMGAIGRRRRGGQS